MSTVEEIKAAALKLSPDEQYEVFRWWLETDAFRKREVKTLQSELAIGIDQLDQGRFTTYNEASLAGLAEAIKNSGRKRLAQTEPNA